MNLYVSVSREPYESTGPVCVVVAGTSEEAAGALWERWNGEGAGASGGWVRERRESFMKRWFWDEIVGLTGGVQVVVNE